MTRQTFEITVDGQTHTVSAEPDMPLLYALRGDLAKKGPKFGCGLAQCGACTVLLDGEPIRSCVTPIDSIEGEVRTLDGLAQNGEPHPVQAAFIEEEAPQCGYCTNGWMMYAVAMLEKNPDVSDQEIRDNFAGLKCRCGTHMAIMRATKAAATAMKA